MNKKLFFAIILLANFVNAQTYTNGGLSTGATSNSGTAAPSGYTWSEVQNNTGNTTESNTNAGYLGTFNSATNNVFLADDFTVPLGTQWQVSSIDFFAYQTGYTGATNPFTTVRVNIYSSDPSVAGAVSVFGDDTTNRYASGADSNMYRIFNSTVPTPTMPGTTRKIWRVRANTAVTLNPGTYWIKYQLQNVTAANGGFLPSVTVPGTRGLASFNAKQFNAAAPASWSSLIDIGNPDTAPDYTVDMPFIVTFTAILGTDEVMQYDNRIQVYPNPVKETFKISNPEKIKISSVEIIDASGKFVKMLKGAEEYNVSDLPKGNYILKIKSNELTKITKLLKQ
jgi:hypothetical protein